MSELKDVPFEEVVDDKDIPAFIKSQEVIGVIQCQFCDFWGRLTGLVEASDPKWIKYVCSACQALNLVKNNEHVN